MFMHAQRLKSFLLGSSTHDLNHMAEDGKNITADCQFCRAQYVFDLKEILSEKK